MASTSSTAFDVSPGDPEKPQSSEGNDSRNGNVQYQEPDFAEESDLPRRPQSNQNFWKKFQEGQKSDWWFASTGIPLLAAALGPLANVLSIAALVSYWRATVYFDGQIVADFDGVSFRDPRWCYWLNVVSLVCGFLGNLFLLLNFTQRIRYIITLPLTIMFWYIATGILIGITSCMEIYTPPHRPYETYTQGFWYAVAAAAIYLVCSMILMVNMLGFFLGHYPETFALTDAQRTLILQAMLFFIWLAGGAAVFSRIETDTGEDGWAFADALYFCDVTILTVGFGDLYPTTDVGRGIVFPYSVGGIVMLGLVISSIYKFMRQLSEKNVIQKHIERMRTRTLERTVTSSFDLRQREYEANNLVRKRNVVHGRPISGPSEPRLYEAATSNTVHRAATLPQRLAQKRKPRLLLLREEKDRFDAMRRIQQKTNKFKKWYALSISVVAFGVLWCIGAVVFWQAEKKAQGMTYFQALYFCYVSLLTIGYGDLSPKSNAGRCFFVVWSLIAVPTMTILVSDMGDTVVDKFKTWANDLADFTVLPKYGIWRAFLEKHPWLMSWLQRKVEKHAVKKRLKRGFEIEDPEANPTDDDAFDDGDGLELTTTTSTALPVLAQEAEADAVGNIPCPASLARRLAQSIRRVATDLRLHNPKRYEYEEWVEFTRLIRFSSNRAGEKGEGVIEEEEQEGLVEWDWIGEDSPLMSGVSESEWLLSRLCESLVRVERRAEAKWRLEEVRKGRVSEGRSVNFGAGQEADEDVIQRGEVRASGANGPSSGDG
ncbi:voltage-gated potassium channel [Lophiostoma macrostomum CBS 122681]|uniref:Voltage-gated potassium channel n=1 Tax=Lophiostoma macrostomum CBS 122681 TaxID=1314788 RepID=A0A6A6TGZ7_9PLEO|nr:voltage-gated potassium channel [Lophiostoma macrostomum CBS 122681]